MAPGLSSASNRREACDPTSAHRGGSARCGSRRERRQFWHHGRLAGENVAIALRGTARLNGMSSPSLVGLVCTERRLKAVTVRPAVTWKPWRRGAARRAIAFYTADALG
jgi:hypothetical protein